MKIQNCKVKNLKVYLAGQSNEHDNNWKELFKVVPNFDFYDWEIDSDQTSADTYFTDDLRGVKNSDILVANPSTKPSEATWFEIGFFYANNVKNFGDFCENLIIIWKKNREPKWAMNFFKKSGVVVETFEQAIKELKKIKNEN